jgi:hypothetical protein
MSLVPVLVKGTGLAGSLASHVFLEVFAIDAFFFGSPLSVFVSWSLHKEKKEGGGVYIPLGLIWLDVLASALPRGVAAPGVCVSEPPPADQRAPMFFEPCVSKGLLGVMMLAWMEKVWVQGEL